MPVGRLLIGLRDSQRSGFVIQIAGEHNRLRQVVDKSAWRDDSRMAGQVGQRQAGAVRRGGDKAIPVCHQLVHFAHQQSASALRANIFDRRNEARRAEAIRPVVWTLTGQLIDAAIARDVVEGSSSFGAQNGSEALGIKLRQFNWL